MKLTRISLACALAALLSLSACGGARYVLVEPQGGAVAIPANTSSYRDKAMELITDKCPNGFDILREEEFPIGKRVRRETTERTDLFDTRTREREYTVRTRFEWRIHFRCE